MNAPLENIISLRTYSFSEEAPNYMILYSETENNDEFLFMLSPHVMRWSSKVLIFDLSSTKSYWESQSTKKGVDVCELWESLLEHYLGASFLAVLAPHPWQGLVMLSFLQDESTQSTEFPTFRGVHSLQGHFLKEKYKCISWKHWWSYFPSLYQNWKRSKSVQRKNLSELPKKLKQFQRFVGRMSLSGPFSMKEAEGIAIQRRFSSLIRMVWDWTFMEQTESEQVSLFSLSNQETENNEMGAYPLFDFPWVREAFPLLPLIERHLEYPLFLWETIEPLLVEDLVRLCKSQEWTPSEKVLELSWSITLYNLNTLLIPISYRNPHSLHGEAPHFKTTLCQAYYGFLGAMEDLKNREEDLDLPDEIPFVSWSLSVQERIYLPPRCEAWFFEGREDSVDSSLGAILELENRLPREMQYYCLAPEFVPEKSFRRVSLKELQSTSKPTSFTRETAPLRNEDALCRPLYFFEPRPIEGKMLELVLKSKSFIERTSESWWEKQKDTSHYRDYFSVVDEEGQILWVFRNSQGQWFQQGLYS